MTVPIAEVGRRGRMDLAFALRDGRTVIRKSYCEVPYKITRALDAEIPGLARLILMQCTAGLFGGDDIACTIEVDSGARVELTQQAATKVHPSGGRCASQQTRIQVKSGAELVFDCEPLIPFAGSLLHQSTRIEVESGSRLVFWEGLMAGRIGKDELWRFQELTSETRLELEGHPLYVERFSLKPPQGDPVSSWIMKNAGYVGTGLCFSDGAGDLVEQLRESLPNAGVDLPAPNLVVVRVVAASGPEFHNYREAFRSIAANFVRSVSSDAAPEFLPRR